jgi:MoaA/NifB/PqqE/SkfB family radical SAM enzyme
MKFVRRLAEYYPEWLRWVHFEITWRCNLRCVHCIVKGLRVDSELTTQEVEGILLQLKDLGCFKITLTGGEPLMRNDIFRILNYGFRKGFVIMLLTNATLLNKKLINYFRNKPISLQISFYGASARVHDGITGVEGSFKKAMDSVELLSKAGVRFHITYPLMKENLREADRIKILAKKWGVEVIYPMLLHRRFDFNPVPKKYMLSDTEMIDFFRKDILKGNLRRARLNNAERRQRIKTLMDGLNFCFISPQGRVHPGFLFDIQAGDLRREDLSTVWKKSPAFRWLRNISPWEFECYRCSKLDICCPSFEESYFETHNIYKAPQACCRIVRAFLKAKSLERR